MPNYSNPTYGLSPGQVDYMEKLEKQSIDLKSDPDQKTIEDWTQSLLEMVTGDLNGAAHFYGSFRDTAYENMKNIRVPQRLQEKVYQEYKALYFENNPD